MEDDLPGDYDIDGLAPTTALKDEVSASPKSMEKASPL